MSLEDDAFENMQMAQEVEELLQNVRPDQRGAIYTMLLIYTAHSLGVTKERLLEMVEQFFDTPNAKVWN